MRHGLKIKKIGRDAAHRKATLQSMSIALIAHKRITTTLGKARALRMFVEPILHHAKDTSTNSRRQAFRRLQDKEAVKTLYAEVASAIADRPGGYTRIVKLGQRDGDAAEMAIVEIVDFNDVKPEGAKQTRRRTRRSRGGSADATASATQAPKATGKTPAAPTQPETDPADIPETPENEASASPVATDIEATTDMPGETATTDAATDAAADAPTEAPDTTGAEAPAENAEAEAIVSGAATPDTVGNPVVPTSGDTPDHSDSEQGAAPGTGEPPPEAGLEQRNEGNR